jgi:hypothetical protein
MSRGILHRLVGFWGVATVLLVILALGACAGDAENDAAANYNLDIKASDFVESITNPFLPLKTGNHWVYEVKTDEGTETIDVRVLDETRIIMGVKAEVVRDTVTLNGAVKEDTLDWYAQDNEGNVSYLGEDTKEYEDGKVESTEGSWEWGVDSAKPGIVMKAQPTADQEPYYQEYFYDEAEDQAKVVALGETVVIPYGTFNDTVTTNEWTRLEKGIERADYARGIGLISKQSISGGPANREELIVFEQGT